MAQFFIAYSRRDFYFAESLFYALHGYGLNAWMDVWKITPGADWDNAISNAIRFSQGLILVASKDSLQSPFVRDEICRAHQAHMPIYLAMRGAISDQDLRFTHEFPQGQSNSIALLRDASAIVDMRANFASGVEKLAACLLGRAVVRDRLPGAFSLRVERILYIPPMLVALVLTMTLTEVLAFGIEIFYLDGLGQLMAYLRDAAQGRFGELILLVPGILGAIIVYGALVNVLVFGVNFARRKRITAAQFYLLLASSFIMLGTILFLDGGAVILDFIIAAMNAQGSFLPQGDAAPGAALVPVALLVFHAALAFLIVALSAVFVWMASTPKGKAAILRWLPTGYASRLIRYGGNIVWIKRLPDLLLSPPPSYASFCLVASPADALIAAEVRSLLEQRGYTVKDDRLAADCDLVILSPFADDSLLKTNHGVNPSRPVMYILARSVQLNHEASIALQWIDYRRPSNEQFWKQWEKRFSNLTNGHPVFPYVPESLVSSELPERFGCGIGFVMSVLMVGIALLVGEYEYVTLVKNAAHSELLLASILCLLVAGCIGYYTVVQILRAATSPARATRNFALSGILMVGAAFLTHSSLLIVSAIGVALGVLFAVSATGRTLRGWLPTTTHRARQSLLQPMSAYRAVVSSTFLSIMLFGFLFVNAVTTNTWIAPHLPQQQATRSYAIGVPGPYNLAAPGLWEQDTFAKVFGYHFAYQPDTLEVSQSHATGYPTWVKFDGVSSSPMLFAPHFTSSVHVHFANSDLRTDFGLVLNDFVGTPHGPQLRLSASGLWMMIESNGKHYSDQLSPGRQSHDYTLQVEVNGILCIFKINGEEVTELTDPTAASVKDIMFSLSSFAPDGTQWSLSDFTYTPLPGPGLSQSAAIQRVTTLRMAPYTTSAPGWTCNPDDGRWNASYEPAHTSGILTCTPSGTLLNTSPQAGAQMYFTNSRYGEFPSAFDYSFNAVFEGTGGQCISASTYANASIGKLYVYVFDICSDGTWAVKYVGYHPDNFSVFLNQTLSSGHISSRKSMTLSAQYRSTKVSVTIDGQFVASYQDAGLIPSILLTNEHGAVLYSDFTYTPRALN